VHGLGTVTNGPWIESLISSSLIDFGWHPSKELTKGLFSSIIGHNDRMLFPLRQAQELPGSIRPGEECGSSQWLRSECVIDAVRKGVVYRPQWTN
jgi:hypothetical protein